MVQEIALERIQRLFELAEQKLKADDEDSERLAKRYVGLAKLISTHYRVKVPNKLKNKACKKCKLVLLPGITCSVRLSSGFLICKCRCGNESRVFVK